MTKTPTSPEPTEPTEPTEDEAPSGTVFATAVEHYGQSDMVRAAMSNVGHRHPDTPAPTEE